MAVITRDQVESNSYLWPDGTVVYQQWGTNSPTGDRPDCSGYVGGCCWNIPVPVNTVTLVTDGWMYEVPFADRRKGDAFGLCGPGTSGDAGHIQLYIKDTATGLFIAEQAGGPPGPRHRTIKNITAGYKTYRFRDIADGSATEEDDVKFFREPNGGIYMQDGVDVATRLPILWPVHNPGAWEEYASFGYSYTQVAGIDWRWWRNGDEIPASSGGTTADHVHSVAASTTGGIA
jgi:hypothetical protein